MNRTDVNQDTKCLKQSYVEGLMEQFLEKAYVLRDDLPSIASGIMAALTSEEVTAEEKENLRLAYYLLMDAIDLAQLYSEEVKELY